MYKGCTSVDFFQCTCAYSSGWPSGLRRQTQDLTSSIMINGVFWSTYVGMGSNPIPDTLLCFGRNRNLLYLFQKVSTELDLKVWPKNLCFDLPSLQYSAPPIELSVVTVQVICGNWCFAVSVWRYRYGKVTIISRKCSFVCSRGLFRSTDLWVMGPARFLCATLLKINCRLQKFVTPNMWCEMKGREQVSINTCFLRGIERSFCMRELLGSTPRSSIVFWNSLKSNIYAKYTLL